jgi:hypothetical protein
MQSVETGGKNAGQEQLGLGGIIADAKLDSPSIAGAGIGEDSKFPGAIDDTLDQSGAADVARDFIVDESIVTQTEVARTAQD